VLAVAAALIATSGLADPDRSARTHEHISRRAATRAYRWWTWTYRRWYSDASPWNTPIHAGAPSLPQSRAWLDALYGSIRQINVNRTVWTPTVITARPSAPRKRIGLSGGWVLDDVPVPPSLVPSSDRDAHAVIVDAGRSREYDFFHLWNDDGTWHAASGVVLRLDGSGWYNGRFCARGLCGPWGARASSAALGGGLIRISEARAGVIPHALACSIPRNLVGSPISPATTSDGHGHGSLIPMGARLQLDPALDVTALGLEPGEEMIARALQTYGAYVVDSSSSFALNALSVQGLKSDPYPSSWENGLSKELLRHMRVVAPPPAPIYDNRQVFGQPRRG
jgi:hypothetical protein